MAYVLTVIHFVCCISAFMTMFLLKLRPTAFFVVDGGAVFCCCCLLLLSFVICLWFVCFLFVVGFFACLLLLLLSLFFVLLGFVFLHAVISYRSVIAEKFINEVISFRRPELRSCVKVEVAVLGSPSLMVFVVSVDVKKH